MDITASSVSISLDKNDLAEEMSMSFASIGDALARMSGKKTDDSISNERIRCGEDLLGTYRVISEPIEGGMGSVYRAYDETLATPRAKELLSSSMEARRMAKFVEERRGLAACLEKAEASGELVKRMFHGDPKVNNIMIDDVTGKGTAMIDLDTVSPGLIHLDFGDALRSICNPAGEEETNLAKVVFDEDLATAFCKGYMREAGSFMTDADRAYLYDSIRLLPFELGLRFFQDFLAGDVYFKTSTPGQNLNRARVQFRLCESVEARERSIRSMLDRL